MRAGRQPRRPPPGSCPSTSSSATNSSKRRSAAEACSAGDNTGSDMATEIKVPTLGESVTEATVGQWFKKEGDAVARDEPLVELETDKVTIEVPAPVAGRLEKISVKDGETVGVGALLGTLEEGATGRAAPINAGPEEPQERAGARTNGGKAAAQAAPAPQPPQAERPAETPTAGYEMPPAPAARKLMQEKGISSGTVTGTGKRGQTLKGDVLQVLQQPAPAQAEAPQAPRP